ncbi:MAG: flagellar motor protein MotB [Myxococcota bacterium]
MARRKKKKKESPSAPAWMATFADMATLLMSFFVLLLAFSEMDVVKYKAISGSMKKALGVKADSFEVTLPEGPPAEQADLRGVEMPKPEAPEGAAEKVEGEKLAPDAALVRRRLASEIEENRIDVEAWPDRVIIRLPEQGVFPLGSARLDRDFVPILAKIRGVLADTRGSIVVAGHTDDLPIRTRRFRSNWDLSASRAASVVHVLLEPGEGTPDWIEPHRLVAQGYADTRPLVPNEDAESRAKNRRVDIILATEAQDPEESGESPEQSGEGTGEDPEGAPGPPQGAGEAPEDGRMQPQGPPQQPEGAPDQPRPPGQSTPPETPEGEPAAPQGPPRPE